MCVVPSHAYPSARERTIDSAQQKARRRSAAPAAGKLYLDDSPDSSPTATDHIDAKKAFTQAEVDRELELIRGDGSAYDGRIERAACDGEAAWFGCRHVT